jgi:hypothetical protein
VFEELLGQLDGNPSVLKKDLRLEYLLPQILPGHRLWCYAAKHNERFLAIERFEVLHSHSKQEIWLSFFLHRDDLSQLGVSPTKLLSMAQLSGYEVVTEVTAAEWIYFQQKIPTAYAGEPAEALATIIKKTKNKIWETVKVATPYRKPYIYCCPSSEQRAVLPQMLSVYLLMFF